MPSFDIVSEVDQHEVANAVDQANREVGTRFDFKGSNASYAVQDSTVQLKAQSEFQLQQMIDILQIKLAKRGVDIACLEIEKPEIFGKQARQTVKLKQGVDAPLARKIVKLVKDSKLKVQAAVQGDQVRVTGKNRDDLQAVIALIRRAELEMPLQYQNFRD